jgi:uncharacterized integral membrane protein
VTGNNSIYFTIIRLYVQVAVNYRENIVSCMWIFEEDQAVLLRVYDDPYTVLCGLEVAELTCVWVEQLKWR